MEGSNVTQQILAIQRDQTLTDAEKAKKRQALLSGKWLLPSQDDSGGMPPKQLRCHGRASLELRSPCLQRRPTRGRRKHPLRLCLTTVSNAQCAWSSVIGPSP